MLNYTTEDLILYLYGETSAEETQVIEKAIQTDWAFREQYEAIKASMQHLDSIIESPRPQSVDAILNYAKTSAEVV